MNKPTKVVCDDGNAYELKSVLDNMETKEEGFPLGSSRLAVPPRLEIVGACPSCGSPIYGNRTIEATCRPVPVVYFSCTCCPGKKTFEETVKTK